MASVHTPTQNHLLAALSPEDYARLLPNLELIAMPLGGVLTAAGFRANLAAKCGLWSNERRRVAEVGSQNGGPSSETGSEGCGGGDCVKRWCSRRRSSAAYCRSRPSMKECRKSIRFVTESSEGSSGKTTIGRSFGSISFTVLASSVIAAACGARRVPGLP